MGFTRDGDVFRIEIDPDDNGFTGRECPQEACQSYFKVEFGTGLEGEDLPCICPYCGHSGDPDSFWTRTQLEYAESVALREVLGDFDKALKRLERRPRRGSMLSLEIKVESRPYPIAYYAEEALETEVVCTSCSLRYSIFGVFGCCPDCGIHNSLQIVQANFAIITKMLELAEGTEPAIRRSLIENALEDAVSSFDGFGRELCRLRASTSDEPKLAQSISFQNLEQAEQRVAKAFGLQLSALCDPDAWRSTHVSFQRRHLLAHSMGVIDQAYLDKTGESTSLLGRRVEVSAAEVEQLVANLREVSEWLFSEITETCRK